MKIGNGTMNNVFTDPTKVNQSNRTKGTCPKCNRKSKKFASLLGKHFDYGRSCPNCRQLKDQNNADHVVIQHASSMPPYSIPSTLVVPSSSCHESKRREDEHQEDDNMTIISEITMDRALLEQKKTPLRPSVESSQQTSSSSSLFTPTTHLIGQEQQFAKSMETLTEETEDYDTHRYQYTAGNNIVNRHEEKKMTPRQNRVHLEGRKLSNSDNITVEYTVDKIDRSNLNVQSLRRRESLRSPSRSLPPNGTTQLKSVYYQQEERMSRSYDGDVLHCDPSKKPNERPEFVISDSEQTKQNDIDTHFVDNNETNTPDAKKHSASNKDIPIVLKCIQMYPKQQCVERGFQTLFLLATEKGTHGEDARRAIISQNGIEILNESLRRHERNPGCVVACFDALWALSFLGKDEETEDIALHHIQRLGILRRIIRVLELHDDDSVHQRGFDLLNRFLYMLPPDQLQVSISAILKNLPNIDANSDAFAMGIDAINRMCQQFDDSKILVAKHIQIDSFVFDVLTNRSTSFDSKKLICNLLWCVTSIHDSVLALMEKNEFITCHVIAAMKQVPRSMQNASFHEATCGTLANLAMLSANHGIMDKTGAVGVLCQEIRAFEESEYVLSAACTALANLSVSPMIRSILSDEDGIAALLFSMKSFPNSLLIQTESFRALCGLCCQSPESFVPGINIITSAVVRHSDSRYIEKAACSILCSLSVNEECRSSIISAKDIFEILIRIQKRGTTNDIVQNDVVSLLGNLSLDESVIPVILKQGFVQTTVETMGQHQHNKELQESACYLLWKLASFSPEAKIQICSDGGIQYLVKVCFRFFLYRIILSV